VDIFHTETLADFYPLFVATLTCLWQENVSAKLYSIWLGIKQIWLWHTGHQNTLKCGITMVFMGCLYWVLFNDLELAEYF
jgi:hypothetical protein